jgi:hypothetical protein
MEAFAANPYSRVLLEEKVEAMEKERDRTLAKWHTKEVELENMKEEVADLQEAYLDMGADLQRVKDELKDAEWSERQNKEDALRLEIVRAAEKRAAKGLAKDIPGKYGSKFIRGDGDLVQADFSEFSDSDKESEGMNMDTVEGGQADS